MNKNQKRNIVIRRTNRAIGQKASSSYVIPRQTPVGRSIGGQYRFSKTRFDNALHMREDEAWRVVKSLSRKDPLGSEPYTLVEIC